MLIRRKRDGVLLGARLCPERKGRQEAVALTVTYDGKQFMTLEAFDASRSYEMVSATEDDLKQMEQARYRLRQAGDFRLRDW